MWSVILFHIPCQIHWIRACEFDGMEVKGHKSRLAGWLGQGERGDEGCVSGGGSGVVFHHLFLVRPSLQSSAGISHTLSADPHITHSCVNKERGEMEKGKQRQGEGEGDLIQTGGHQRWRKNEAGMPCMGTHYSTKRTTNQAQNCHTLTDKQVKWSISPSHCMCLCVPIQRLYLELCV